MSLVLNRLRLMDRLVSGDISGTTTRKQETLDLIIKWFVSYKLWEKEDRFLKAIREGRMTMRQAPAEPKIYGVWDGLEHNSGFKATSRDLKKDGSGSAIKFPYDDQRQRADIGSIKERMNPINFGMSGGERLKYKNGLHDMSASLCVPHIPKISDMMRWKHDPNALNVGKSETEVMVFMPLPEPEDLQVYYLLSTRAKQLDSELAGYVAMVRKRMTRLKLADSADMATGMRDIGTAEKPKLRYGLQNLVSPEGKLTGKDLLLQQNALDYRSILPKAPLPVAAPPPLRPVNASSSTGGPPPPLPWACQARRTFRTPTRW